MAREPAGVRVGIEEPFAPGRKGALLTGDTFGVKREVFAVGGMSGAARRLLWKRLGSELHAVRDLIRKSEFLSPGAGPAGETGAAVPGEDGRFLSAGPQPEAPMEADGSMAAKRRKVSPFVEQRTEEPKGMAPGERERLAERLASLAAALPDHVVAFLQNKRGGDADSRGDGGEIEMDMHSMKDGALFQLKLLLDKFAPASRPKNHGRAALDASGVSCLSQHQDAGDKIAPVEDDEDVYICRGVSRISLRDIAEEYGELVDAIGVEPLSPLQRKYVDLIEQDEYVDICGDASPVVFPAAAKAIETSSSPSSSSSDSDASSSDSDSGSCSDSDSKSDSDESDSNPPPKPVSPKEDNPSAESLEPAPEALQITEPEELQDKCAVHTPTVRPISSGPPAPLALPKKNDTFAQPPESAPEALPIAKPEELQDRCAAHAPTVRPITSSPPVLAALPKENDTSAQPPGPAPEAVQIAMPEELQDQCAAPAPTVRPIISSPPAPAALPKESDTSAQPLAPAPEVVHSAEPEELQDLGAAPAPAPSPVPVPVPVPAPAADPLTDLIAKAQEALERRRQEERDRAREKARQELLEVERAALPDERIHPADMELLGIAAFEHIVSTVEADARAARPRVVNGGGLRVAPGCPSALQFLGLFLKADNGGEAEEQERRLAGFAPGGGEHMDVEEGEIR